MSFVYGEEPTVIKARSSFLRKQGLQTENAVFIKLEHGTKVHKVGDEHKGNLVDPKLQEKLIGDGLITDQVGLTLFMVVADCIGAIIYDPAHRAVGLIHAGRKGVEQNILAEAVGQMKSAYGSSPSELRLITSPAISAESYVFDSSDGIDTEFWGNDLSKGEDGKWHMDVKSKFSNQALECGLQKDNISIDSTDTFTDKNYFSHRRSMATGESEGRFAVFAQISPN
jgi:YfiH family protein